MSLAMLAFLLVAFHFVCDYSLQNDFMAVGKNPANKETNGVPWYWIMASHSFVHGAAVAILTQSVLLGLAETVIHFIIDVGKCKKLINADQDQCLHVACKILWWAIACFGAQIAWSLGR